MSDRSLSMATGPERREELLAPLRSAPARAAILCDIDGTLAPIAEQPSDAVVPRRARALLAGLASRYGLVACVSGRRALEARRMVGLDSLAYAGNHGLELLASGESKPRVDPRAAGSSTAAADFVAGLDPADLGSHGLRVEDKGPIQALHWRGAGDPELAEARARELARQVTAAGLLAHFGRMVLEVRPAVGVDKGTAVRGLLHAHDVSAALYGGDDRTDLDAFAALRALVEAGELAAAVCVGVASPEGPAGIVEQADVVVDGPGGFTAVLEWLA